MHRSILVTLLALLLAACATSSPVPEAARLELAPTGKLRAGMNPGNTLFPTKDAATGELRGVSVDLMRGLANRLAVPVVFVVNAGPGEVAEASGFRIASPEEAGYALYLTQTLRYATLVRTKRSAASIDLFTELMNQAKC